MASNKNFDFSVIIPAYNESGSIVRVIREIFVLFPNSEVIVVDDGSTDDTADLAIKAGAKVLKHPYNMGNGAAVKTGMREAKNPIFITMDADGQHDPKDIQRLVERMDFFDMAVGERSFKSQATAKRAIGNIVYNSFASYITSFKVKDLTSGFRAVKREVALEALPLFPNTYSYPTTLTLVTLKSGFSVSYVPIVVKKRQWGKSGINLIQDGVKFLMIMIKITTLYSPLRVFLPMSLLLFFFGIMNYGYTFFYGGRFTNMSAVFFLSGLVTFMMGVISEQICQMRYEKK